MLINVIFGNNHFKTLTYRSNERVKIGQLVYAGIRGKTHLGMVLEIIDKTELSTIRDLESMTPFILSSQIITWSKKIAEYYLGSLSQVLEMILPTFHKNENQYHDYYRIVSDDPGLCSLAPTGIYSISNLLERYGVRTTNKYIKSGELIYADPPVQVDSAPKLHFLINPAHLEGILTKKDKPLLLMGPTGSGKTTIAFEMAKYYLKQGKQILFLLPEVALSRAFAKRAEDFLGFAPHIWTYRTHQKARQPIWEWAYSGRTGIVFGARSSLWLPFQNLGCIIVDEEHDSSYKQENDLHYQARDAAVLRAKYEGCQCVLISATPSCETWNKVQDQKYYLQNITGYQPISGQIIKTKQILAPEVEVMIKNNLEIGRQSLLFINRRGFASYMLCTSCKQYNLCNYCSAKLIFYKNGFTLCRYCNQSYKITSCELCRADSWCLQAFGIEYIEEKVQEYFPQAKILTVSSDTPSIDSAIQEIYSNAVDIIISTQILSKGYTFPNLALVVILNGDSKASSLDPRHNERLYQLCMQLRGRTGRSDFQSLFIIQYYYNQDILKKILNTTPEQYIQEELQVRNLANLPPFYKLIRIVTLNQNVFYTRLDSEVLFKAISTLSDCTIYPPSPAILNKCKSKYRYSILIQYHSKYYIQPKLQLVLNQVKLPYKSQIIIDVDPYTFI